MKHDYYDILGVTRRASSDDVKRAFRRLAQRYHPDKNPGDSIAEERFKEVNEAYAVLADPERRREYDRFGRFAREGVGLDGMGEAFQELFGDLFRKRRRRRGAQRGAHLRYTLELSFEDAAAGAEKEIAVPRLVPCDTCSGTGAHPPSQPLRCEECGGTGELRAQQGFFSVARMCPECGGVGRRIEDPCGDCEGSGRVPGLRHLKVKVPAGIDTGHRLRLGGEGEEGARGGGRGDLYVHLRVRPHPLFVRDENDVICEFPISFAQAALGAELEVPTLDGKVRMEIPAGTQSGKIFRLRQKGIPALRGYGRGDQLVRVKIETPRELTTEQQDLLAQFAAACGEDAHPQGRSFLEKVRELFG